jgi:choline dehydrogenase-like flavoprotein
VAETFDYIVVGAGTAGCVVAARLSERGASVLLLEMGRSDTDREVAGTIAEPRNVLAAIWSESISRRYWTTVQPGLGSRPMLVHRGVVSGGCSSVHGMVYVRGNPGDYDHWQKLGNEGWGYRDVLPYFRKSENYADGASTYHGADGPLDVRYQPKPSEAAMAFVDAAATLGYGSSAPTWDFNGVRQEDAAGLYQYNVTADGRRASAAVAFLDGLPRKGALVYRRACVARVNLKGTRAVGVECLEDGATKIYRARREVIVSCGAFESPKVLMLSGIGPADHLSEHGIEPVVDLPGVGRNLHDHLQILVYHMARRPTGVSDFTAEAGLFVKTTSAAPTPDLQYHVLAGMIGLAEDPRERPNFLMCPVLCQPQSRGSVRLADADPRSAPLIDPNYLDDPDDIKVLRRGLELMEELARTGALGDMTDPTSVPFAIPDPLKAAERLPLPPKGHRDAFIRATAVTVWHPVGTCKMGHDDQAVVDSRLRVRGVEGLRVADASIMPRITSGNTNAPSFMIGEVCAAALR